MNEGKPKLKTAEEMGFFRDEQKEKSNKLSERESAPLLVLEYIKNGNLKEIKSRMTIEEVSRAIEEIVTIVNR